MKLIGITGSCGKTSVAEIVYQYLLFKGHNASLYSSNGMFVNGLTRQKDFFQTTLYGKDLEKLLEEDAENNVEFAVIEITAESVKRNDTVHLLAYDVVALTSFYSGLHNHFDNKENYYLCKRLILTNPNAKKVLLRMEDNNYTMFSDIKHITYGYSNEANHQMLVINNTLNGLKLFYKGEYFNSNLISAYHARNIACALAILEEVNAFDYPIFKDFAKNIFIRGRFEKVICNNKTVIIDTGYSGSGIILSGLETTLGSMNYKVIFSIVLYDIVNDWVKNSRKQTGKFLKRSKFIYLTNPTNDNDVESTFLNEMIVDNDFNQYKYIPDINDVCKYALRDLKEDEVLIIFARDYYRQYRNILMNINEG